MTNEYPRGVHLNVLLYDNMIINWKTGSVVWDSVDKAFNNRQPLWFLKRYLDEGAVPLSVEHEIHICNSPEEVSAVFQNSDDFYKKWKLHPRFNLISPYKENK